MIYIMKNTINAERTRSIFRINADKVITVFIPCESEVIIKFTVDIVVMTVIVHQ